MKRILSLVVIGLLAFNSHVFAAQATATMGDQNASGVYRVTTDINGVLTYAQDTGIVSPYTTATTNTTMTASQSGTTMVFTGSSNNTKFTLPTAAVGLQYTFIDDATVYINIVPQTSDTINFASLSQGQYLANSSTPAKGDAVTLFCAVANKWSVKNMRNTWVGNNN